MKDKVSQEHVCEEEVPLNNNIGKQSGDFVEMPSEAVEQRIDGNVPYEIVVIMEYLVNISKRCAFWSLKKDILKINDSDTQYVVSIKEYTAYLCLHSPKTTKERRSIRRIQRNSIQCIEDIICEYSGRYQMWSLL
ncbi:hypothetical protein Tco_0139156 [Tanacetum coccineum]